MSQTEATLDKQFWENRYRSNDFGWDLGQVSPPLKAYFDGLTNKDQKILIPGAGNSYEAEYLYQKGFSRVFVCDLAPSALQNLKTRCPHFPEKHLIEGDFFNLQEGDFDLIIEQTFFCAIHPSLRRPYFETMHRLLKPGAKLCGLLFNDTLNSDHPPFGGSAEEYRPLFQDLFSILHFETCYNSIAPRANRELFMQLIKV